MNKSPEPDTGCRTGNTLNRLRSEPPADDSAHFVIQRVKYPEYYTGHSENGFPGWISNRDYALKVHEHKLVEAMKSITGHGEISATLIAHKE